MNEQSLGLVRAIRGPIILITVGTLFAFDKFTEFRFSQTWPVLLIVLGLLSLAGGGRSARRNRNAPAPGVDPGVNPGVGPGARP
jgi:hypothetical protein